MASYEVEHSTSGITTPRPRPRRPDLSTFFAALNESTASQTRTRPDAVPTPGNVGAAHRLLAEAYDMMRRDSEGGAPGGFPVYDGRDPGLGDDETGGLITQMIRTLLEGMEAPPREIEGVSEEFCDGLKRVKKESLKPDQFCPICNNAFLDDKYPLVVQLPCHTSHLFDLECIKPWIRLRGTCPLDRVDFAEKERAKEKERLERIMKKNQPPQDDEEEEWDGMYG